MEKFVIEGGVPLSGTIVPAGNKNAALPLLACACSPRSEVILHNVPRIRDTEAMLDLLADLGVTVERRERQHGRPAARPTCTTTEVDAALAERIRASFLVAGPLLARFGRALMPPPGGDVIGRRRLDPHLDAFRALGADRRARPRHPPSRRPTAACAPCDFFMDEPSVMGTENALMAAAADRRHDDHPQRRLRAARAGPRAHAQQDGRGDRGHRLQRHARPRRRRRSAAASTRSRPDHIEIASFMALAGVTGGELRISGCVAEDLRMIRLVFQRLGLRLAMMEDGTCLVPGGQKLVVERDAGDYQSKVEDGPWPAFPADLTSIAVALATQSEGSVLIFEKMFENRLFFVDKLISMGAEITICDPHRAIVIGPRRLRGAAALLARHPRRHGDADRRRCAPRARARSTTCARSTAATSASTSACGPSGARIERVATSRRDPPDPQRARATSCRTRCASCARSPTAIRGGVRRPRLRRGRHARARVRGGARRAATRRPPTPPTGCSTSTATCSCCART